MNIYEQTILGAQCIANPEQRYAHLKRQWKDGAFIACCHEDARRGSPLNANSYSAQLLTEFLTTSAITKLQNSFGPVGAFTTDFSTDRVKPLAPAEAKFVTGGSTAQVDATNFEQGGSTIGAEKITPHQITVSFNVTNAELQSGLRLDDLITANMKSFGDAAMAVAKAPLTVGNFTTNTALTSSASTFGWSDMTGLLSALKKSNIHNAVLDGDYYARLLNTPSQFQRTGPGRWQDFGWDRIEKCNSWAGAGANVHGIACNPQAIGVMAGLPLTPPISSNVLTEKVFTLPELELSVAMYSWFQLASRTAWVSFDIVIGSILLDETAGVLIKSA